MSCSLPREFGFVLSKSKSAAWRSLTSRYLAACAVYFIYSVGMILADAPGLDETIRNVYYLRFGVVHLINAFMFVWTWEGKSYTDKVLIPEYLNIVGAVLYLWSSTLYGKEYSSDDDGAGYSSCFHLERQLEFWASIIEVFAAFGWIWTWHIGYQDLLAENPYPVPARGWTLDDPDISANITIATAAVIYFVYNWQVFNDNSEYETNHLYKLGDQIYLTNSVLYLVAALRDCGWFWFMPKFGQYKTISAIMEEELHGFPDEAYSKVESACNSLINEDACDSSES